MTLFHYTYSNHDYLTNLSVFSSKTYINIFLNNFQKRKSLRTSVATTQRRIKSNGVNDPTTISLVVDKFQRGPERAWPGDSDIRQRRIEDSGGVQPVPRYLPAYTSDVSHLIV